MNISFHHKAAFALVALTLFLVCVWRYDFRSQDTRHQQLISSLQNDLRDRDQLSGILEELNKTRAGIDRVAAQGKVDDSVAQSLSNSLNSLVAAGDLVFPGEDNPFEQLSADVGEFFKIAGQLSLYENKLKEFIDGSKIYFQTFEHSAVRWRQTAADRIAAGETLAVDIPFDELDQRISTLEKVIPEFTTFKQRERSLKIGFEQWTKEVNTAKTATDKQQAFAKKEFLLKGVPELTQTFNEYVSGSGQRERTNVQQIATQITESLSDIQVQVQDKFAVKNNAVQTVMAQNKYKDEQYRKVKYAVAGMTFATLIFFFFAITIYAFRFEKGLAIFRRKTFEAAQATREITSSLKDNSSVAKQNFDLTNTLKQGLENVSQGFLARQSNLQNIDNLVRDTDALIKESQANFTHIKDEFYNAEKISQEIVHLTGALEGVASQMTSVAERVAAEPGPVDVKEKTIDELKYLAGRIRYAVNATHATLDGRTQKIEEAKGKFSLIEANMTQMTENTHQALKSLALARLDHSEEVSRVNEILENTRNTSRVIVSEIETLNKQINDFSILSKHLAALHELAVKASALNAQSLLTPEASTDTAETINNSQRMNQYVQEYFKKVFENPALKSEPAVEAATEKPSRIQAAADG